MKRWLSAALISLLALIHCACAILGIIVTVFFLLLYAIRIDSTPGDPGNVQTEPGTPSPDPGTPGATCGTAIHEEYGLRRMIVIGDQTHTRNVYGLLDDLGRLGYWAPRMSIRDAQGALQAEGEIPYLEQDDRYINYTLDGPRDEQCVFTRALRCDTANDDGILEAACFIVVPPLKIAEDEPGNLRLVETWLVDGLLAVYDGPAPLALAKRGELYLHEGLHAQYQYGPSDHPRYHQVGPNRDQDVHGPYGAGLLASTKMISDIWRAGKDGTPGPRTGTHYSDYYKANLQHFFVDATLLNTYTVLTVVDDPTGALELLRAQVHQDLLPFVANNPAAVGTPEARVIESFAY